MEKSKMQEHGMQMQMSMQMPMQHGCPCCMAMCCMPMQPQLMPQIIHYMMPHKYSNKPGKGYRQGYSDDFEMFEGTYNMYGFDEGYDNYFDDYHSYFEEYGDNDND